MSEEREERGSSQYCPRVVYADSADSIRPYGVAGGRPCVANRGDELFLFHQALANPNTIMLADFVLYCVKAIAKPTKACLLSLPCIPPKSAGHYCIALQSDYFAMICGEESAVNTLRY